jgi:hypothetical protein
MPMVVDKDGIKTVGTTRRVQSCGRCPIGEKRWGRLARSGGDEDEHVVSGDARLLGWLGLEPAKMLVGELGRFQVGLATQLRGHLAGAVAVGRAQFQGLNILFQYFNSKFEKYKSCTSYSPNFSKLY